MEAPAEYQPARVSVALDVATEGGDGEQRIARCGPAWQRLLRDGAQHVELRRSQGGARWGTGLRPGHVTEKEKPPGDGREERERVEKTLRALELPALVLAAGLQRLEVLLDRPRTMRR